MRFVEDGIRVSVPATSANLGPGFDALGLALSLRDHLQARVTGSGLVIDIAGSGADAVPRDESHLVVRAMRAAFDKLGAQPSGLHLQCDNLIPHGRGLGSSSAAIVAGVSLARALVEGGADLLDDDALFQLAAEIEGHPDNVAPAFFGGFVISGREGDAFFAARSRVDPRISAVVFVPPTPVETTVARGLLPAQVSHADAAANSGRAALLVAALAGQPDLLWAATRDFLHQDYREPAMPESLSLVRALRADQVPAIVSGAGPTVLAFVDRGTSATAALERVTSLVARCPDGWQARPLAVESAGVIVG
ncbi:homoserine kinase [Nocardioides sp.]|uniref:homoserine kinase n=1 Tax=Nocardioides sp. TaxID=35761 RepID=UPI003D119666